VISNQVYTGNVAVDPVGHTQPFDFPHIERAREDDLRRNCPLVKDELAAVDVVKEVVQGADSLLQAGLQTLPASG
jgi:hypothetical protein